MKKILCMVLTLMMVASVCTCALSVSAAETSVNGLTITKISNPDAGEREVDGLIAGGDRENSYTWRLAMRGDEIYIATTRNIASALVNMYGGAFSSAGIDIDTFWSMIDVVTNGDIPRNDANEGANIISYNRKTGEFKVIYTAGTGDYFRMAVTFGDDVYFGSYSAVSTNPQYILKLDPDGNFTKVFETMGSVSLRANCVYDEGNGEHLYFAGADDRETVAEGETAPVAKMAVLRKSNEDDTVWERVADFRDFGTTAYDPIHTSWAGAPIWELANHDGYIYATAPTHAGFVIYKGHPAEEDEEANEYGWNWTEVAGLTNGVNNPGLSDVEGGEPGTMRSLIGSVYEFNGELYAYNFDHSFGGEASAFAGMMQQIAGQDVKASEYLFYLYDSLRNPQKVWKLNDETGKFEELTAFTDLMEGTTNEYVWRLGEYNGDLYVATMDAGIFYNYLTQLTNGSFFKMSAEEKLQKLSYIGKLLSLLTRTKGGDVEQQLKTKLEDVKTLITDFDPSSMVNEDTIAFLKKYSNLDEVIAELVDQIKERIDEEFEEQRAADMVDESASGKESLAPVGAALELSETGLALNLLSSSDYNSIFQTIKDSIASGLDLNSIKDNAAGDMMAKISDYLSKIKSEIREVLDFVDWQGVDMYVYINNAVKNDDWGFDLFRTSDGGSSFEVITRDGFGDKYNYGCPSFLETEEGLYLGTCNPFYGGQLYLIHDDNPPAEPDDPDDPADPDEPDMPELRAWYMLGDADGDGKITILDSTVIQRYLAGIISEEYIDLVAGDITKGGVDITDATYIQRHLVSLKTSYAIGEQFNRITGDPMETVEETVIADTSGVKVTLKSLGREYYPYLTLNIENSGAKDVAVSFNPLTVNGFQSQTDFAVETDEGEEYTPYVTVKAGVSADYKLGFNGTDMNYQHMSEIAQIGFVTRISDPDTNQLISSQKAVVNTSAYGSFDYSYDESGETAYDDNGIKLVYKGLSDDGLHDPMFYINNQSEKDIVINVKDFKLNGTKAEGVFGAEVFSGCRALNPIGFFEETKSGDTVEVTFEICERSENHSDERVLYTTDAFTFTL
ncbi:MAG: hypothetical protein IJ639_09550 [Ruminococcus sp.]|nr:hypothetical protein [Ruminococcus sp.]